MDKEMSAATPASGVSLLSALRRRRALLDLLAFAGQRLAFSLVVLLSIILLCHLGLALARGLAPLAALSRALAKSLAYVGRLARGDLGWSDAASLSVLPVAVASVLPAALAKSLGLLVTALLVATVAGVALGLWAARHRHTGWSLPILLLSIIGTSLPSFFAALLLQLAVLQWARAFGRPLLPVGGFGWDQHIILPALVLIARPVAQIARVTFVSVGEILDQDLTRTAHGKGLPPADVLFRHVVPNAAIPILTTVGLSLRYALISLPVVEFFFGWHGLGYILLKGIAQRDDNLTVALVLALGALLMLTNLILEISYRLVDPRLRQQPPHVRQAGQGTLGEALRAIAADLRDWVLANPLAERLRRRPPTMLSPAPSRPTRPTEADASLPLRRAVAPRARFLAALGVLPFVLGGVLVAGLLLLFLFGPQLAPHSPYTTHGLVVEGGEWHMPPFAPDPTYPWGTDVIGRDMLSLILAGVQQTMLLAALAVLARLVVGFVLGTLAGWLHERWVDRLLMRLAEIIAAFPALLLAMMLILALGIREGLAPFIVAFCFIGWGEIMQFVRGQVLSLRARPFVESAVAVGLRTPRLIVSHILPNLVPALVSLAALEMGAVLMLLGELGFIGIFMGGGAFAQLEWLGPLYHYSDVPEWGALLSNVRRYARSAPWMALYPSLAFFVTILAFNLSGEGVRRLIERSRIGITRLINRLALGLVVAGLVGVVWARGNAGPVAIYRQQAGAFDGERALADVRNLSDPALGGRALGTPGMEEAAALIAHRFEEVGLQAAGQDNTYWQTRPRAYETLDTTPVLTIEDGGRPLVYRQDYAEYPGPNRILGSTRGRIRFWATGELSQIGGWGHLKLLQDRDFGDEILIVPTARDVTYLEWVPCGGILVLAPAGASLDRAFTMSGKEPIFGRETPILWISEATADRLLAGTGRRAATLRRQAEELGRDGLIELPTGVSATIEVQGTTHQFVPVRHVIGHLPGRAASIEGAPEAEAGKLDNRLIVVLAPYDSAPLPPGSPPRPSSNDNASGLATMLEVVRTMRDTGYQPSKTFLFIAYSGEGVEGGERIPRPPDISRFLEAKTGFTAAFQVEAIVELRALGAGDGGGLVVSAGGSTLLADLLERSARLMGVPIRRAQERFDVSVVFEDKDFTEGGQESATISVSWDGWEATSRLPADTAETVSADKLGRAGQAITLALMTMGRETRY